MMKLDPIIAVKDVKASSEWYQSVFGCKSKHGGDEFEILVIEMMKCFYVSISGKVINTPQ